VWISLTDVWWCDWSGKIPRYTMNKGKIIIEKNICRCNLIQFSPKHVMLKIMNFLYFYNCWNLNFGPTGVCCQEWNNLVARGMVAKSKHRLATNSIFTNVVVSLLTVKYQFSRLQSHHFISATKICYLRISVFHRIPIGHCGQLAIELIKCVY